MSHIDTLLPTSTWVEDVQTGWPHPAPLDGHVNRTLGWVADRLREHLPSHPALTAIDAATETLGEIVSRTTLRIEIVSAEMRNAHRGNRRTRAVSTDHAFAGHRVMLDDDCIFLRFPDIVPVLAGTHLRLSAKELFGGSTLSMEVVSDPMLHVHRDGEWIVPTAEQALAP